MSSHAVAYFEDYDDFSKNGEKLSMLFDSRKTFREVFSYPCNVDSIIIPAMAALLEPDKEAQENRNCRKCKSSTDDTDDQRSACNVWRYRCARNSTRYFSHSYAEYIQIANVVEGYGFVWRTCED